MQTQTLGNLQVPNRQHTAADPCPKLEGTNIVFLDDSRLSLAGLVRLTSLLHFPGAKVIPVECGPEDSAQRVAENVLAQQPHAVFVDGELRCDAAGNITLHGGEIVRLIKEKCPNILCIGHTANVTANQAKFVQAGADLIMEKGEAEGYKRACAALLSRPTSAPLPRLE
jgi:hypothetical protein